MNTSALNLILMRSLTEKVRLRGLSILTKLGSIYQWYDKSAFGHPAAGHFGTCRTNSLWGQKAGPSGQLASVLDPTE